MTTTISLAVDLPAPADRVWTAVCLPATFRLVTRGVLWLPSLRRRTSAWLEGETVGGLMFTLGLPTSVHSLTFTAIDHDAMTLRTDEHGGVLRMWRHTIEVTPTETGCRYRDTIEVDAGRLTPVVVPVVTQFFRLRQRRWQELAQIIG